jgi:hypothetical protein
VSLSDVAYDGQIYQIKNNMYPFLLYTAKEWKCSLLDVQKRLVVANSDRFAAKWISSYKLSQESQEVFDVAEKVYKAFYANLGSLRYPKYKITSWDAGFYQIRKSLEEAGIAKNELTELYEAHKLLGKAILPRIYEYGFLSGKQFLYEDEADD